MSSTPKGLLFDLDGVLLNTEPLHGQAWTRTAASFGTHLNLEQLKLLQGRRRHDCARQVSTWIDEPIQIDDVLKTHKPISQELLRKADAMPGAESLITWCYKSKFPIALVTSSNSSSVANKTHHHKWLDFLSVRVQGDDPNLLNGKPAPDPYLLGAKKLNFKPEECWAIEDSLSGTKSALSAGCKVFVLKNELNQNLIASNYSNSKSNPRFINELTEILNLLKTPKRS